MPKGVLLSLVIVAVGAAWLLNTLHFIGGVDWVWTICLAAVGAITLGWGNINKLSFVIGLFLLLASLFSVLRQTGMVRPEVEVPLLVMALGLLFLLAQLPAIPQSPMIVQMQEEAKKQKAS